MTTPNELYQMEPTFKSNDVWAAETFVEQFGYHIDGDTDEDERVEVKTIAYKDYDGRRIFSLETYWFDGLPVGFFQRAGREGDDHKVAVITNNDAFTKLKVYLESLEEAVVESSVDPDAEYPNLLEFYQDNVMNYR